MFQPIPMTLLALGALPLVAQDGQRPPVFSIEELTIRHYKPVHLPSHLLVDRVGNMVGRTFYLQERGGTLGDSIDNLSLLGDTILLYDTSEYLVQMSAALEAIDQPMSEEARMEEDPWVTFHYTPRYLSMDDCYSVVEQLTGNISVAGERRILVVHDNQSIIRDVEMLLGNVDQPEDQILVTAYLVRGFESDEPQVPLPGELTEHLGRLVPGLELQGAGFAMLQSTAVPRQGFGLQLQLSGAGPFEDFTLAFRPTAYDRELGSLTVESCELVREGDVIFSTSTIFRGGEYTVLGATGAEPLFVVVRLTQM